jgi:hypothetical protein
MNHSELANWQAQFITSVFAQETRASSAGMAIYRNNLLLTHRASILLTFSRTCALLGDNAHVAIYRYLTEFGKSSYDWAQCGEHFAQCLAQQSELAEQSYISDMARYEWCRHQINRAPAKPFNQSSIGMLSTHDWTDLYLDLAPGWALFSSDYDIPTMFDNSLEKTAIRRAHRTWVCWRNGNAPQQVIVPPDTHVLYQHASTMNIQQLADLTEQIKNKDLNTDELDFMAWLASLMQTKQLFGLRYLG